MTYTTAHGNAGSLTHWPRPGIEPASSRMLVRFVSAEPRQELLSFVLYTLQKSVRIAMLNTISLHYKNWRQFIENFFVDVLGLPCLCQIFVTFFLNHFTFFISFWVKIFFFIQLLLLWSDYLLCFFPLVFLLAYFLFPEWDFLLIFCFLSSVASLVNLWNCNLFVP